ncbi:CBM_collapsed_G0040770.mRNA.1.CDS.1 [Saccharomyces cerevisiae]|nr:CBM_collapsed_G0040770.mRNA.1.CDS.1 [Saccharomyces cerevisiae]
MEYKNRSKRLEESNRYELSDDIEVPEFAPSTKELNNAWSVKYWPLIWNGNPNDQILNDYKIDMQEVRNELSRASTLSVKMATAGKQFPMVSVFVDPSEKEGQSGGRRWQKLRKLATHRPQCNGGHPCGRRKTQGGCRRRRKLLSVS